VARELVPAAYLQTPNKWIGSLELTTPFPNSVCVCVCVCGGGSWEGGVDNKLFLKIFLNMEGCGG
jgi:hypothetical protein